MDSSFIFLINDYDVYQYAWSINQYYLNTAMTELTYFYKIHPLFLDLIYENVIV